MGIHQRRILLDELCNAVENIRADGVRLPQSGGIGVADGHLQVLIGVLHHGELGLGSGVPLAGLVDQGGIGIPLLVCQTHGAAHLVGRESKAFQHIALAHAGQAQVLQDKHGIFALLVQLAQTGNEALQRAHGVAFPCCGELRGGHAGDPGKFRQGFVPLGHGGFDGVHGFRHSGTASLRLNAHGGHCCG